MTDGVHIDTSCDRTHNQSIPHIQLINININITQSMHPCMQDAAADASSSTASADVPELKIAWQYKKYIQQQEEASASMGPRRALRHGAWGMHQEVHVAWDISEDMAWPP